MSQQLMNQMQSMNPPWQAPASPEATMLIRAGRPNCGWIRRELFELKALGRITSYTESTGWLFRSFAITGPLAQLQHIERCVKELAAKEKPR